MRDGSRFGPGSLHSSPRLLLRAKDVRLDARKVDANRVAHAGYSDQIADPGVIITFVLIMLTSGHAKEASPIQRTKTQGQPAHGR
jgi:hypothetical protein